MDERIARICARLQAASDLQMNVYLRSGDAAYLLAYVRSLEGEREKELSHADTLLAAVVYEEGG